MVPLAVALVISGVLGEVTVWGQSQPPGAAPESQLSDAERARRLADRNRMAAERAKLAQAGKLDEAEALAVKALAATRELRGELHEEVVISLQILAGLQRAREDWAAARKTLTQVLAIRERQPDRKDWQIGDARRAMVDLDRLAAMTRDQRRRLQEADRLNRLQDTLQRQGKYAEGIASCGKAVEIRGELLGQDHPDYAHSLTNLAWLYQGTGDYVKAERLGRQAVEIRKRALGENHPLYAQSLEVLAVVYRQMGDLAKAEPLYRQAREIKKRAVGENHLVYADSLNNLANLYKEMGELAKAEPLHRQALEIRKRVLGENHPDYAASLNNLANLYKNMRDFAKAEPLYRQALEIRKRVLGENHSNYAGSLNNLANLYKNMRDYRKAEPLYRQALEIRKRMLGENHPLYAQSLDNLANLYEETGDYTKAEPLHRQALEIRKRALGENHPDYADSLNNLAVLYRDMGDYAKAEPLIRQALEIKKRSVGEQNPDYARSLNNLARLYYAQGQLAAAEQCYSQELALLARWTQEGLAAVGERQRIRLLSGHGAALDHYLSVAPAAGIKTEAIYRQVLAWKGAVDALQDEDRLARDQPELKATLVQLEQARARLAQLAFTAPPAGQRQSFLQQLDALRDRKENLESDLARKSAAFRQVQETWRLGAAEVAAALPPGTVLVDMLYYNHYSPPQGGKGPFRREGWAVAFVLRRGQAPMLVPLGDPRAIDQLVRAWRQALELGRPASMTAARALRRHVWEPLEPHLEGATTVLVIPDGALTQFPLAALPGHRPDTYLLEDLTIGYVSSAHRLVETLAAPADGAPRRPGADAAGLLAVGGIDYVADPGPAVPTEPAPTPGVPVADPPRSVFGALAGTGPEVRRIGQLFDASFPRQHALVLTGAAPTEATLKQQLRRQWRHLHLATHGFFESPARVAAIRAGVNSEEFGPEGAVGSEESASLAMAPLLHSGVALAGAGRMNQDAGPGAQGSLPDREDGILTAEEVQAMDLRGTDLVVLSACETGLGKLEHGQGVQGLQRAFQAAGARAVVASLWKVDDAATTLLMEQFYANLWSKKLTKLEALRQAQLTVLNDLTLVFARRFELAASLRIDEKAVKQPNFRPVLPPNVRAPRSDPALWAAFVLSGDGR
jgi:CHAT domain-containing protein/Tfp pilus assembly protein PilF